MRRAVLFLAVSPTLLFGHSGEPLEPHDLWSAWRFEPGIVILLLLSMVLYGVGANRSRAITRGQQLCFWAGCATLVVALISPLHPLGEVLFSAHMAQHEVLMLVAAPLLVLSRPLVAFVWGLPFQWRRATGRWAKAQWFQRGWQAITAPFSAWCIHALALWAWHIPALFEATLRSEWVHTAQHLSFFLSALLFWWSLFYARGQASYGAGVLYVFTTGVHTSILGALLTFAQTPWYPSYAATVAAWGLTPVEDQQIGGLIMWVPGGLVYLAAGLFLFSKWVGRSGLAVALMLALAGCSYSDHGLTGGDVDRGKAAIEHYGCGSCHTISRIRSCRGRVGPPLSNINERMFVAGMLPNTPDNLETWIRNPKSVNDKTVMPNLGVSTKDATDIAAFLYAR